MDFKFIIDAKIEINIENCNFKIATFAFLKSLQKYFQQFITALLLQYFEYICKNGKILKIIGIQNFQKKSVSVLTKFKTIFGDIYVPQIQIRTKDATGKIHQISITRTLLGVGKKYQIPDFMQEILGFIGSLSSYRVGHKITGLLTNFKCSLMSVWNSVQRSAKKIILELSPDGTNEFQADGTGIQTHNTGKRGSELKKIFQVKNDGKLHLVGIEIGNYKDINNWLSALSAPLKKGIEKFGKVILASDGDKSITECAKSVSLYVKIQKDIWHVFHQLKYYLWLDKVPKEFRSNIIKLVYKITMVLTNFTSKKRLEILGNVINTLIINGYTHTATYLKSSMEGFYTYEIEGNKNLYTSKTERSMRTTNQRANVGVWSEKGILNAIKIRLAYYYNGISPSN